MERFLFELLAQAEAAARELTLVYAGNRLRQEFPSVYPVHAHLGFKRLTDLVRDIEGLSVRPQGDERIIVRAPLAAHRR